MKVGDKFRMSYLKLKRKIINFMKSGLMQWLFSLDITFVFLFFMLYLFGFEWNLKVLIASFGTWIVIKEMFKLIKRTLK